MAHDDPQSAAAAGPRPGRVAAALLLVLAVHAGLVSIRWTAPTDLLTRDQERVATYVLDITHNGHWIVQHDVWGAVASKPPLFNWLAAVAVHAYGEASRIAVSWPSWFATLVTALLVFGITRRHAPHRFATAAATWAALLYLVSQLGLRQVLLVRTDSVFQLCTFLAAWAGWHAWRSGGRRGWAWFWIAVVAGTLTKAPHVVLFAAGGLAAVCWQRDLQGGDRVPLRSGGLRPHLVGLAALAVGAAWFAAAVAVGGQPVLDKLLGDELAGHVVGEHGQPFGLGLVLAPAWFLTRLAPMSLLFVAAAVRAVRMRGAPDGSGSGPFERYWMLQVLVVVVLVGFGSKARFVHLLPAMPGAAMLAGIEAARLVAAGRFGARLHRTPQLVTAAVFGAVALAGSATYLHVLDASSPPLVAGVELRAFAEEVEARAGDPGRRVRVYLPDDEILAVGAGVPRTGALQFWWNAMPAPLRTRAALDEWLAGGADRGFVCADPGLLDLAGVLARPAGAGGAEDGTCVPVLDRAIPTGPGRRPMRMALCGREGGGWDAEPQGGSTARAGGPALRWWGVLLVSAAAAFVLARWAAREPGR